MSSSKYLSVLMLTLLCLLLIPTFQCPSNCQLCNTNSGSNYCYLCQPSYQLILNGSCTQNAVPTCKLHQTNNKCFECKSTYLLREEQCVKDYSGCLRPDPANSQNCIQCGFGRRLESNKCEGVINCKIFSRICTDCADNYQLVNNVCVDISEGCLTTRPSDGLCQSCRPGYNYIGYKCIKEDFTVKNCQIYDEKGNCSKCAGLLTLYIDECLTDEEIRQKQQQLVEESNNAFSSNGQFNSQNNQNNEQISSSTQPQNNNPSSSFSSFQSFESTSPTSQQSFQSTQKTSGESSFQGNSDGFSSIGTQAKPIDKCVKQDQFYPYYCLQCQNRYYPDLNKCIAISSLCDQYNPRNGNCESCLSNFRIQNGKCIDPNCLETNGNICQQCNPNYKLNRQGSCQMLDVNCVQRSINGQCLQCVPGYFLLKLICTQLPPNCLLANSETGLCVQCRNLFQNQNGNCIEQKLPNCVISDPFTKKCTLCEDRWYPKDGFCQPIQQICEKYHQQSGFCQKCIFDFLTINNNGFCVDPNCIRTQNNVCVTCKQNFSYNVQSKVCELADPNCQQPNFTFCLRCKNGFYKTVGGFCQRLPENCNSADADGKCLQCANGYKVEGSKCMKIQIQIQIQNCKFKLPGETNCALCEDNYYLKNNICIQIEKQCLQFHPIGGQCFLCISGYDLIQQKCRIRPEGCEKVSQNGICTSCFPSYTFSNGICKQQTLLIPHCVDIDLVNQVCSACEEGYYPKGNFCTEIQPQCSNFNLQAKRCFSCVEGFYIHSSGLCQLLPANCRFASPSGQCSICSQGYELKGGICSQIRFIIQNCEQIDNSNRKCIVCKNRFYLNNNSCIPVQSVCQNYEPFTGNCFACDSGYYINQNKRCSELPFQCNDAFQNGQCRTCKTGYFVSNGQCLVQQKIQNCARLVQNRCESCLNRYYLSNNVCLRVSDLCSEYDKNTGKCLTCINGYSIVEQRCVQNTQVFVRDVNCLQVKDGSCVRCSNRYYISQNGRCVVVNPLCRDYNPSGNCTDCYQGYSLFDGKCIINFLILPDKDPNCKRSQNNICIECYRSYYYDQISKKCERINPLCRTANLITGACLTCYSSYSLNLSTGKCQISQRDPNCRLYSPQSTCLQCSQRYYMNKNENKCKRVHVLCREYDRSEGFCLSCYPGYHLSQGQCIVQVLQCKTYTSIGTCSECYPGYVLKDSTCKVLEDEIDTNCRRFSPQNNKVCLECYQGYIVRNGFCQTQNPLCRSINLNNGNCTQCYSGYYLLNGNCIKIENPFALQNCEVMSGNVCSKCLSGFYFNREQGKCTLLDQYCATHNTTSGECLTCFYGYILEEGRCIIQSQIYSPYCERREQNRCVRCIDRYYLSNSDCVPVSLFCRTYNHQNGNCLSCVDGYFFQDNTCIQPGHLDPNCVYYTNAFCSRCRQGYYVNIYECIEIDSNCLQFDYGRRACNKCRDGLRAFGDGCK